MTGTQRVLAIGCRFADTGQDFYLDVANIVQVAHEPAPCLVGLGDQPRARGDQLGAAVGVRDARPADAAP